MRITIETDGTETTMTTGQQGADAGGDATAQAQAAPAGRATAPPEVLAKAAAEGAINAGPAPSGPPQGPGPGAAAHTATTSVGGAAAGDMAAGAAPGMPDVSTRIEVEEPEGNGGDDA